MTTAQAEKPRVLHAIEGRVRVHVPAWSGRGQLRLEALLRQVPGVTRVEANPLSRNVLVQFHPHSAGDRAVLRALDSVTIPESAEPADERESLPPVVQEKHGSSRRARIAVRGLDRNPRIARVVIERLQRHPSVRATPNLLTGRVLVEYDAGRVALETLLAEVMDAEMPEVPGEDRPTHPLDPAPLLQSATRTVGSGTGLMISTLRRLGGASPARRWTVTLASVVVLLQSFPFVRNGLRKLLGRHRADLLMNGTAIVLNTLADNPLSLTLNGTEALALLTEVMARRAAWHRYEDNVESNSGARPGEVLRLEAGERMPLPGIVIEGSGTATGRDGLPRGVKPGTHVSAGALLAGGPFVIELRGGPAFEPLPRPAPLRPSFFTRYLEFAGPAAFAYAGLTGLLTWSVSRTFSALLLVNPRVAVIGSEAANLGAASRVLRAGVTVVGTRPKRAVRLPSLLLLDGPRLLTDGLEMGPVLPLSPRLDAPRLQALAAAIAAAAGSPWGKVFPTTGDLRAGDGEFNGLWATASVEGVRYTLGPPEDSLDINPVVERQARGGYLLALAREGEEPPLGVLILRPRLSPGVSELVRTCRKHGVRLAVLEAGDPIAAQTLAHRAGIELLQKGNLLATIRTQQATGDLVALVADSSQAAEGFAACDLAIGLSARHTTSFPARADLLAPDLIAVAAIMEAGARREAAVRDAVLLSVVADLYGAVQGLQSQPGLRRAGNPSTLAALLALGIGWLRLRGGERAELALAYLVDPHPERWGRRNIAAVLRSLNARAEGLRSEEVARRLQHSLPAIHRQELLAAVLNQLRYPTTSILGVGAVLSLALGQVLDASIIAATVALNVVVGTWQERQVGRTRAALHRLGTTVARVLRDGEVATIPAHELVPGDVLLLAAGDRVAADARVLEARGLEVDEASLTGESLPVPKVAEDGTAEAQIVLEGSDVVVGTGKAVVVAVGRRTRMGATAAALEVEQSRQSPLGLRLGRILQQSLPLAVGGGLLAFGAGLAYGRPWLPQLGIGASIALAVVPEGLPLLAGVSESAMAKRLAARRVRVHRLAAVEALGRVDVVCTDKTGTLTEGRLCLRLVTDGADETTLPGTLPASLQYVLRAAALASPHPDDPGASAHPTDLAVVRGAQEAGLSEDLHKTRQAETGFDPDRAYHATLADNRIWVKGAPEVLVQRCRSRRRSGNDEFLDTAGRAQLLEEAHQLARRGLRVLLVAEGRPGTATDDPRELTALGFVGISDPIRPSIADAVRRCQQAGIRIVMITGDHPATAAAIAREAGLQVEEGALLTGSDLSELEDEELEGRLRRAAVIARASPLDKLRIVERLQHLGHTVAMTGDGVNDAPALRLADVGVAMGRAGTEVARQTADVVLADDDFSDLVEAFIEGRSFWQNMRRAVSLLLGGNVGEVSLIVGATVLGTSSPLNSRQILVVNLITDALPALSVVLQEPEHRRLESLAREGTAALDRTLRQDVFRRGAATALPTLAAYLLARRRGSPAQASSVAYTGIVAAQLVQTLDVGWVEGRFSPSVLTAVAGSGAILLGSLVAPPLRSLLGLEMLTGYGWMLVGSSMTATLLLSRLLANSNGKANVPTP